MPQLAHPEPVIRETRRVFSLLAGPPAGQEAVKPESKLERCHVATDDANALTYSTYLSRGLPPLSPCSSRLVDFCSLTGHHAPPDCRPGRASIDVQRAITVPGIYEAIPDKPWNYSIRPRCITSTMDRWFMTFPGVRVRRWSVQLQQLFQLRWDIVQIWRDWLAKVNRFGVFRFMGCEGGNIR